MTGVNGTIVLGTNSASEPMSYIADGEVVGYEIDIIRMICAELGYGLEIVDMDFSALIPSLVSGKIDVAAASISITEERALSVDFSVPDYYGGIVLIVRSSGDEAAASTLWDDISTSFTRTFIQEDRWKMLLQGLGTTLVISLFGVLFGTLLSVGVCFMRRSRRRWLSSLASGYVKLIQGIPVLVLLMILYFIVFGSVDIAAVTVAIIGPSGTGKSTLLRALNLLDPPTTGEIFVSGENILAPGVDVNRLRQKMGMVFQSFNLYSHLSVAENIMLAPIYLCGTGRKEAYGRALELLEMVGLRDKAAALPMELSGGQKQRVAIARTLAMDPEVILLDEPTSALDPTMVSKVISVIRGLSERGLTMLIVTHEMRVARDISTRVFYMDGGVIFEDGTPDQIFNHAEREQTRRFVQRVRSLCYHVTSATFNLYELNGRLEDFCTRHVVGSRRMGKIELVCEEMIVNLLIPRFGHRAVDIELEVEFSEDTNGLGLTFVFPDLGVSLLEGGDLPEMIVGSIASEVTQSCTDGQTTIRMSL